VFETKTLGLRHQVECKNSIVGTWNEDHKCIEWHGLINLHSLYWLPQIGEARGELKRNHKVKSQGATKNYWGLPIEILENLSLL
jgi:hypothetical protein